MLVFILLIVMIVLWLVVWTGFKGIQRTGNYENRWGYMFWYGMFAFLAVSLFAIPYKIGLMMGWWTPILLS